MNEVGSPEGVIGFPDDESDEDQALENAVCDAQGELLRVLLKELLGVVRRKMKGCFPEEEVEDVSTKISRIIGEKIRDVAMTEAADSLEFSREGCMTEMGRKMHRTLSGG